MISMRMRHYAMALAAAFVLLGAAEAQAPAISWYKDLAQASEAAQKTNQPMLIDFWADWCAPCKIMDAEVYSQPALIAAIARKMIVVRIHYDLQPEMVRKYNVPALPYLVFTNSYGTELMHHRGFLEADDLTAVINALPADVAELNRLDRGLQEDKNDFRGLVALSRALRTSGFYESSNLYYAKAVKQDAAKTDAAQRETILYDMALNALELRNGKSAAVNLERCLKEFPKSERKPDFLVGLGRAYALDEKKDKARKTLNSVIAEFPESPAAAQARSLLQSL